MGPTKFIKKHFLSLFLGSNQYWVGMVFVCLFLCREHPKAQPTVVLVSNVPDTAPQLKVSSDILVEPGIELRTPGYKARDFSNSDPSIH